MKGATNKMIWKLCRLTIIKKRKRQSEKAENFPVDLPTANVNRSVDTSKPSAVFKPIQGRAWTVSVALPGSVIAKYVVL